jgi:hypothetical protein
MYTFSPRKEQTTRMKGVVRVLVDYREEIEQVKRITYEGWGRL